MSVPDPGGAQPAVKVATLINKFESSSPTDSSPSPSPPAGTAKRGSVLGKLTRRLSAATHRRSSSLAQTPLSSKPSAPSGVDPEAPYCVVHALHDEAHLGEELSELVRDCNALALYLRADEVATHAPCARLRILPLCEKPVVISVLRPEGDAAAEIPLVAEPGQRRARMIHDLYQAVRALQPSLSVDDQWGSHATAARCREIFTCSVPESGPERTAAFYAAAFVVQHALDCGHEPESLTPYFYVFENLRTCAECDLQAIVRSAKEMLQSSRPPVAMALVARVLARMDAHESAELAYNLVHRLGTVAQLKGGQSVLELREAARRELAASRADNRWNVLRWEVDEVGGGVHGLLRGHAAAVTCAAFSPAPNTDVFLATGSMDYTVRLWDARTGECVRELDEHFDAVTGLAFSPNDGGARLASASDDETVIVWHTDTGAALHVLEGHRDRVRFVDWSPDGTNLVTCSDDEACLVFDASSGALRAKVEAHNDIVYKVRWLDAHRFVSVSNDKAVKVWSDGGTPGTVALVQTLEGHRNPVIDLDLDARSGRLLTGSDDGTARVWEPAAELFVEKAVARHARDVVAVQFAAQGEAFVTASIDLIARLWNLAGEQLFAFPAHGSTIESIHVGGSGTVLATASRDRTARLYNLATGKLMGTIEGVHTGMVQVVRVAERGNLFATASSDMTAMLWTVSKPPRLLGSYPRHRGLVTSLVFSADGTMILTGSDDRSAILWNGLTGDFVRRYEGHADVVWDVAVEAVRHEIGSAQVRLATASWDCTARVYVASEPGSPAVLADDADLLVAVLEGHEAHVLSVRFFAHEPNLLATAGADCTAYVWEISTSSVLHTLKGHEASVWSLDVWSFLPHAPAMVATGSWDKTVRLWSATGPEGGRCTHTLLGHQGEVVCVRFGGPAIGSAGEGAGTLLASSAEDKTVRVWDTSSGHALHVLNQDGTRHASGVKTVFFGGDGALLCSVDWDMMTLVWDVATGAERDAVGVGDCFPIVLSSTDPASRKRKVLPPGRAGLEGGGDGGTELSKDGDLEEAEQERRVAVPFTVDGELGGPAYYCPASGTCAVVEKSFVHVLRLEGQMRV